MQDNFLKRVINKPPFLFPWVAAFHILLLAFTIWINHTAPMPGIEWLQPLWVAAYTISWLFICDMKKWAAYSYLAITSANLLLFYFMKYPGDTNPYTSTFIMMMMAVVFSFLILFFFKRFE